MDDISVLNLILEAGIVVKIVMLILFIASILSWIIIVERYNFYRKVKSANDKFLRIFWSGKDLPKSTYYISAISISVLVTLIFKKMLLEKKIELLKLQNMIDAFSKFMFITAKKHVKEEDKEAYDDDLLETLKKGMDDE